MMTINKLTKTFASGIATISIAAVAGIVNAPSASAQVCFNGSPTLLLDSSVTCGDKVFENFSTDFVIATEDSIDISQNGNEWDIDYDFVPDLGIGTYAYGYDVDITDPLFFFDRIVLDVTAGLDPEVVVVKDIFDSITGDLLLSLTSVNGDRVVGDISGFNVQHISVLDTITISETGLVLNVGNGFSQTTHTVPEPGTILGLLAVGGLGLVSRFKKQK
jgi:hypothetical protein